VHRLRFGAHVVPAGVYGDVYTQAVQDGLPAVVAQGIASFHDITESGT
jgi:hypothetical protein